MVIIDDKRIESKYNEAQNQNFRISGLWFSSNNFKLEGNFAKWNDALNVIYDELVASFCKINNISFTEFKKNVEWLKFKNLGMKIAFYLKLNEKNKSFELIRDKEHYIRILQEELGRGGKYEDPEDEGF
jgi:hypothetical protein